MKPYLKSLLNNFKNTFLTRVEKERPPAVIFDENNLSAFDGCGKLRYAIEGYIKINNFLWQSDCSYADDELEEIVKDIIEISTQMSTFQEDTVLYRGTKVNLFPELKHLKQGMEIDLNGITSTSYNRKTALSFTENNCEDFDIIDPLIFKIKVEQGGLYTRPPRLKEIYEIENEFILHPAKYLVTKIITRNDNTTIVELTQKELLDIHTQIINGLNFVLNNPRSDIHPTQVELLKNKVNYYFANNVLSHKNNIQEENSL